MNIAARFPIKPNYFLFCIITMMHVLVLILGLSLLSSVSLILIVLVVVSISLFYSSQEYTLMTNACDDLCWSGENWLMTDSENSTVNYLVLLETSWITPYFCLLKFSANEQQKAWFFSPYYLSDRLFRELCYLARLDIKNIEKEQ